MHQAVFFFGEDISTVHNTRRKFVETFLYDGAYTTATIDFKDNVLAEKLLLNKDLPKIDNVITAIKCLLQMGEPDYKGGVAVMLNSMYENTYEDDFSKLSSGGITHIIKLDLDKGTYDVKALWSSAVFDWLVVGGRYAWFLPVKDEYIHCDNTKAAGKLSLLVEEANQERTGIITHHPKMEALEYVSDKYNMFDEELADKPGMHTGPTWFVDIKAKALSDERKKELIEIYEVLKALIGKFGFKTLTEMGGWVKYDDYLNQKVVKAYKKFIGTMDYKYCHVLTLDAVRLDKGDFEFYLDNYHYYLNHVVIGENLYISDDSCIYNESTHAKFFTREDVGLVEQIKLVKKAFEDKMFYSILDCHY